MLLNRQIRLPSSLRAHSLVPRAYKDSLVRSSMYLMATAVLTGASGYVYWIAAAHMYQAYDVGLASALINTMMLVATVATLGIGPTLIQVLPRCEPGSRWSLMLNAVLAVGSAASLLAGSVVAAILPRLSPKLANAGFQGGYTVALVVGALLMTLVALLDKTFVAERAAGKMLARNGVFAVLRIPLLIVPMLLGFAGALSICSSWMLAAGVSLIGGLLLIPRLGRAYRLVTRGIVAQLRAMLSSFAGNQLISLGELAPIYLLPVFVAARLSLSENAYFYISWQVGSLFFMVSPSVATALLAEGSHRSLDVLRKAHRCIVTTVALLCPAMLIALFGGRFILSMFGPDYAHSGYLLLLVLAASAVPDAITNVSVSVLRVQNRLGSAALLNLGMATLSLVLAWNLLPRFGIVGAGWAWLIAQTAGSLVVAAPVMVSGMDTMVGKWRRQERRVDRLKKTRGSGIM
jgi:O-antigen/teichoic acid export membrane protein